MNGLNKIAFLLITTILVSCGSREFRALQIDLKERGNENCKNHLQTQNESIYNLIQHEESIMLLKHSDYWSEIDESKLNKKHRIPNRYSHQYKLTNHKWLNYGFHLISNKDCNCNTNLSYYNSIREKLEIYKELLIDNEKIKFIKDVGKSKLNDNFNLIIFGEEDTAENVTIGENRISVPKSALDGKYNKYAFMLVSTNKDEEPIVYYNKSILINLNNLEVLDWIKPLYKYDK